MLIECGYDLCMEHITHRFLNNFYRKVVDKQWMVIVLLLFKHLLLLLMKNVLYMSYLHGVSLSN